MDCLNILSGKVDIHSWHESLLWSMVIFIDFLHMLAIEMLEFEAIATLLLVVKLRLFGSSFN